MTMRGYDPYEMQESMRRLADSIDRASDARRKVGAAIEEQQLINIYPDEKIIPHPKHIGAVSTLEKQKRAAAARVRREDGEPPIRFERTAKRKIREQRRKLITMDKGAKPLLDPLFTTQGETGRETVSFEPRGDR